jgi:hypothetical protein
LKCERLIENAESRENARSVNMSEGKVDLTFGLTLVRASESVYLPGLLHQCYD